MAFHFKNSSATYTRMVVKLFCKVLDRNMEAYVFDMIVKSCKTTTHAEDLIEILSIMAEFNLQLNPKKYTFVVQGGKFWGYMVTRNGIELNPKKSEGYLGHGTFAVY